MRISHFSHLVRPAFALGLLLSSVAFVGGTASAAEATPSNGAVYVLSNATAGNSVLAFNRDANGGLTPAGSYATGGLGTGTGLGSQGALVLVNDNRWLFAVNAGSNSISAFAVMNDGLQLVSTLPSGGTDPISISVHDRLLYVLNAGGSGNIMGFTIGKNGALSAIPGSTRLLSNHGVGSAPGPAQVQFSPNGGVLVVTEKATNMIDTYAVDVQGLATGPNVQQSAGITPFGFAFGRHNDLIVSEAFGGAQNASAVSSYRVDEDGNLSVVSASAATHQTAACWVVVSKNGRYAYTTNAGSGSISGYSVANDGSLALLNPDGRTGVTGDGSTPSDMSISVNGRYLYVLEGGAHAIGTFQVASDGSLTPQAGAMGLPAGAAGIAAR